MQISVPTIIQIHIHLSYKSTYLIHQTIIQIHISFSLPRNSQTIIQNLSLYPEKIKQSYKSTYLIHQLICVTHVDRFLYTSPIRLRSIDRGTGLLPSTGLRCGDLLPWRERNTQEQPKDNTCLSKGHFLFPLIKIRFLIIILIFFFFLNPIKLRDWSCTLR